MPDVQGTVEGQGDGVTDTRSLLVKAKQGDKSARDILVQENTGLVWHIVRRFTVRGTEKEDLFQIGVIGLIKAIDYFDLNYDVRFSTYAVPMIAGEIKRFIRDDGMVKVSRSIKDNIMLVGQARERLLAEEGKEPSIEAVMAESGLSREDILMAMGAASDVESLHKTIYEGEGSSIQLMDRLMSDRDDCDTVLNRMVVGHMLGELSKRDRSLIIRRFYCNQTQSQVAKVLGISQVQVSRLEKKILKKMRETS